MPSTVASQARALSALRVAKWSRRAFTAGLIAAFAAYRIYLVLAGPALIWQDSYFYKSVGRLSIASSGFWAGHFPPLVPLLWKLTGTDTSFVVTQTVVSVLAWATAALVIASRTKRGWGQVLAVLFVLALASSSYVTMWDRSVLSETMTLAFVALFVATLIAFAGKPSWGWFGAVVVSASGMIFCRDSNTVTVGLIALGILVVSPFIFRWHPPRRLLALGAALLLVAVLAEGLAATAGRDGTYTLDDLYVRVFPYPPRDAFFAAHGMPDAALVEQLAASTHPSPGQAPVVAPAHDAATAALYHWIDSGHATTTYALWLITHPIFVISAPFQSPQEAFNYANGNLGFYAAIGSPMTPVLDTALFRWWATAAEAAGALALALVQMRSRPSPDHLANSARWRSREWQMAAALALMGLLAMLIAWQAEGQEVTRHMLEGSVELRLAVLALLAFGFSGASAPMVRIEREAH
jgi:hypothetical protein